MRTTDRNIFYVTFILFFSFIVLALGFYFFYSESFFGQTLSQSLYWDYTSYTVKIHSIKVENGKTFISLELNKNAPPQTYRHADDFVPPIEMYLMADGRQYFGHKHTATRGRITYEFDSTVIPDIIFVYAAGQYSEFKTHKSFDGRTKKPVRFFIPPEDAVDLHTLINQKKLRVNVIGNTLEDVIITFENISGTTLFIKSGIGTWFKNSDQSKQNMALTGDCAFAAESGKTYTLRLPVVCLNVNLGTPNHHDAFSVERFDNSERLIYILRELNLANLAHSEIQRRIWDIIGSNRSVYGESAWYEE